MNPRIAILDDYQNIARSFADWDRLNGRAEVTVFTDHLAGEDELVARLEPFAAVVLMRERTPFPRRAARAAAEPQADHHQRHVERVGRSGGVRGARHHRLRHAGRRQRNRPGNLGLDPRARAASDHLDRDIREGRWQTVIGEELAGKTLGLLGLGRVGGKVALAAPAFGMEVLAWSANLTDERAAAGGAKRVERDELLARADFVSVHLVLGPRTRGLYRQGGTCADEADRIS